MNEPTTRTPPAHSATPAWTPAQRTLQLIAVVLGLVVALQALPLAANLVSSEARAGVVSTSGQLTALTAQGSNEDLLIVLDGRGEELYVYKTDARTGMQLFQKLAVPQLFNDARARNLGR
jgi:hypothetical protein